MFTNVPLAFIDEDTVQQILKQQREAQQQAERRKFRADQLSLETVFIDRQHALRFAKEIDDHKWFLSERLGRDVGTAVATVDFLNNIQGVPTRKAADKPWRSLWRKLDNSLAALVDCDGPRSIANFEAVMRGTRSLAR